jgi:hypothetical protein
LPMQEAARASAIRLRAQRREVLPNMAASLRSDSGLPPTNWHGRQPPPRHRCSRHRPRPRRRLRLRSPRTGRSPTGPPAGASPMSCRHRLLVRSASRVAPTQESSGPPARARLPGAPSCTGTSVVGIGCSAATRRPAGPRGWSAAGSRPQCLRQQSE